MSLIFPSISSNQIHIHSIQENDEEDDNLYKEYRDNVYITVPHNFLAQFATRMNEFQRISEDKHFLPLSNAFRY